MIFTKYLFNNVLKNQLIVFITLFLVFFIQKFIWVFDAVVDGSIPKFLVLIFFGLSIPEIIKLILPISLFFGILITFNYLFANNEIIAMYSCGLGNIFIIRSVLYLVFMVTIFSVINIIFVSPFCVRYQHQLMSRYESNYSVVKLFDRKFQFLKRINLVFFVDGISEKKFRDVFLVQTISNVHSIIVADCGYFQKSFDGFQWIILNSGYYYCWSMDNFSYSNFYINDFIEYKVLIEPKIYYYKKDDSPTEMSIYQLWCSSNFQDRAELHWRLTLIIVVFIMAMIIFPLSVMRLNRSYLLNVFPAMVLYLVFFLFQIVLRSSISKGNIEPLWVWLVNLFYIFIAVLLNFWESVFFRHFRWKLRLVTRLVVSK